MSHPLIVAGLRLKKLMFRAGADKRGVAALEFALLLPILLLMYFGSAEVTRAVLASRKLTLATRALSDLLGQQAGSVDDTKLADIFAASVPVMSPFPVASGAFKSTLSSINFTKQGNDYIAKTSWSSTASGNSLRPCQQLNQVSNNADPTTTGVPAGLYGAGSVVVADVTYLYPTPFKIDIWVWKSPETITFRRAIFNAPRNQVSIAYTGAIGTKCTYP